MSHAPMNTKHKIHDHDIHKFQGKESFLTSQIELFVEEVKPKIPDGGWGWIIVLAAFILNTISEGISFSFGLLYVEFLNEFQSSKSATSWIGSLFLALPLLAGPIGSIMVDRYGCLLMTLLGSLICTIGFVMSVFARSVGIMYVTFGVIGGIGRGLTFVTAVVSIAFWFEKKRTIALGLAASGAGFGTVVFAPFTTLMLTAYGWRGTVLILAGCFLNMCVCGVVMRDPDWVIEVEREEKRTKTNKKEVFGEECNNVIATLKSENIEVNTVKSAIDLTTFLRENGKLSIGDLKKFEHEQKMLNNRQLDAASDSRKNNHKFTVNHQSKPNNESIPEENNEELFENSAYNEVPLLGNHSSNTTPKIQWHSYLNFINIRRNSNMKHSVIVGSHMSKFTSCPNINGYYPSLSKYQEENVEQKWYLVYFKALKNVINFSLFLELHFLLLAISTTILFVWFIVPYFYIADLMKILGHSESQASTVLSIIGFTNTIGMVFLGWAGDRLNIAKTYAICLIFCGISIICMIFFAHNYILLCINNGLFGLFFASCFSLLPSLLAELVPLEDFTMAYGLVLLCEGIGNLMGPPIAGLLFDITGSWDQSFYQAAFWIIACGLLIGLIPYTKNRKLIGPGATLKQKRGFI